MGNEKSNEEKAIREAQEALYEEIKDWWKDPKRIRAVNMALLSSCEKGNAQSLRLAKQLQGELVEKQESKPGLTADERARRNLEAERELKSGGFKIKRADELRSKDGLDSIEPNRD